MLTIFYSTVKEKLPQVKSYKDLLYMRGGLKKKDEVPVVNEAEILD